MIDNWFNMANLKKILKQYLRCVIRRKLMLTVTDKASEVIKDFLKDKDASMAIRITLSIG